MPKATLQFGEWRPDVSLLDNQFASIADNVFPGLNCYRPIPSLLPFSESMLPERCMGLFAARRLDGTWNILAGTQHSLWKWTTAGWSNITRTAGGGYNLPAEEELWSFTQFGDHVIAAAISEKPQWITLETDTNFSDLPGNPPKAHNVHTIGDFVFLSGLALGGTIPGSSIPTNLRQILWSGINDPTNFTPGTGLSDYQEMPDGGVVKGIAGNEIGFIVQDRSIRLLQFLPGDINTIFSISRVVKDKGCMSEFGFATVADELYFIAEDGPYKLGGNQVDPIGQEKVSDWFLDNSDPLRRNLVQVIPSNKPYVVFAFHTSAASSLYNRVMIYNWVLQRWASGVIPAAVYALLSTTPLDLDTTGSEPGDEWLEWTGTPQPHSLDSFGYTGGRPLVCGVDELGRLCSLSGPNLLAQLQTVEAHLVPGKRAFVSDVYPLCDTDVGTISVETRERLGDMPVTSVDYPLEITGSASVLSSSRLHRFKLTIPAGEDWTRAEGVLAEAQPDGEA